MKNLIEKRGVEKIVFLDDVIYERSLRGRLLNTLQKTPVTNFKRKKTCYKDSDSQGGRKKRT